VAHLLPANNPTGCNIYALFRVGATTPDLRYFLGLLFLLDVYREETNFVVKSRYDGNCNYELRERLFCDLALGPSLFFDKRLKTQLIGERLLKTLRPDRINEDCGVHNERMDENTGVLAHGRKSVP